MFLYYHITCCVYIYNIKISRGICICVYICAANQHLQTGRWRVNNIMCVIYVSMYYHLLVWNCNITNIQFILARSRFRYLLYFVYYMGDTERLTCKVRSGTIVGGAVDEAECGHWDITESEANLLIFVRHPFKTQEFLRVPICECKYLTHWGRDKMNTISQTTLSSAFSWMKMFKFRLKFHWSLFLKVQLTIFQHWFR